LKLLVGKTPGSEQRRQARLLKALERQYSARMAAEIERASMAMIAAYENGEGIPYLPDHDQAVRDIVHAMATTSIATFAARVVEQGKAAGLIETKEGFAARFARMALRYIGLEAVRRRITSITETTRAQIISVIARGQDQGLGTREIGRVLRDVVPAVSAYRGNLIARTETHNAANYGAFQAASETGLTLRKEWVAAEDERTRTAHVQAGNDYREGGPIGPIPMDQPFIVGGEPMMYPGDATMGAGPGNTINCRCAVAYVPVLDLDD
jgi:uncharacterized protein with gpF-like domain